MTYSIKHMTTDTEIDQCFVVMSQLRPHLTRETFLTRARSQMQEGYRLACAMTGDTVVAVAGYRFSQSLSWGKFLYVDDLVTDAARRSQGAGKALLQWLIAEAKRHDCAELHLDSGIQRKDAHRFYEREGMDLLGYHYKIAVE
ncbi:MAG: GNAT family N-acetyltransferase [Gammaproteobacteria bacterium]|nr:GNAT family N-acetyltransferase [Gammaproteobacteria bacterium]